MRAGLATSGGRGGFRRLLPLGLAAVLALFGCSDDPPPPADAVAGKTPVVRPEDVHGQAPAGATVLAPDYRREFPAAGSDAMPGRAVASAGGSPVPGRAPAVAAPGTGQSAPAVTSAPVRGPEGGAGAGRSSGAAPANASQGFPEAGCRQLVLVVVPDPGANRGMVRRLEREGPGAPWREAGAAASCVLGRNGLAAGRGIGAPPSGPAKRQGDGRTPSGLFPLPEAFGYASPEEARAAGVKLPYVMVTDRSACVTDSGSALYGRVAGPDQRPAGGSARQERMVRDDGANAWGMVIGHNREDPDPGAGACLFLNVRPAGGPPTGGSIGCPPEVAAGLAAWLDPGARPLLAVFSRKDYQERAAAWGLP